MVHSDGNFLSILVFFLWVPFALWGAKRWPAPKAASLLLLLPLMFLPERVEFDLPLLPPFGKTDVAVLWAAIALGLFHRQRFKSVALSRTLKLVIALLLGGTVLTIFVNTDGFATGSRYLPGHSTYDAVTELIVALLKYVLPFVVGAAFFRSSADLRTLFRMLVGATLAYGVLQLIEIRLSPQLNNWVYGFYQHQFAQMMRGGGYRPMVFMSHGITVAMFTMVGALSAAVLYKTKMPLSRFIKSSWAIAFLLVLALLNKSAAAFVYALLGVPLILFTSPKVQFRVATVLSVIALTYPALRSADLIPVDSLQEIATARFGEERADSLMVRLVNEESLLTRAKERPALGWGTFCRRCIFDPWTGKQTSISDGDWIITIGQFGVLGFLGKYLLLLLPVLTAARRSSSIRRASDRRLLSALALIIGLSAFDLLPNSSAHYLPFVFSGALFASATGMIREARLRRRRPGPAPAPATESRVPA